MKVGIDLGTTNSALAYIDVAEAAEADFPPIHILPIPQAASGQREETLRTLPSFLFLAEPPVVGAYAREQGALYPTKTVHSAKSWLSNPEVDRTAKILPWDAQEEGRVLSPVEASAAYLRHMRDCWERAKRTPLAEQDVVLTVPASFDEEADAAGRTSKRILRLDFRTPGALKPRAARRADCADLRCGRRNFRLHAG